MSNILVVLLLFTIALSTSCNEQDNSKKEDVVIEEQDASKVSEAPPISAETEYSVIAIKNEVHGWGYEISKGDKKVIAQPHIPAIPGVKGFNTKEEALLIGNLGIEKIKQGLFPPTISIKELDSLVDLNIYLDN